MVEGIKDLEFQNECVDFLIQKTVAGDSKQVITVKAPTGAGKTIILIKYINEYLNNTYGNTAFIWLCPGKGNLEEQSKEQMENVTPERDTRNLLYSLLTGFSAGSITFINWELVTKKGNNALKDGERKICLIELQMHISQDWSSWLLLMRNMQTIPVKQMILLMLFLQRILFAYLPQQIK